MRAIDFELLHALEEHYWWFAGMRRITEDIVRPQFQDGNARLVLDAGCGTGLNLRHLRSMGARAVFGIDVSPFALDWLRTRGFSNVSQASVTDLPFPASTFDLAASYEVLCQLPAPDAERGFAELTRVLKPGGFLFIRLPAFEWLRSSHDRELGTAHRYTLGELRSTLERFGYRIRIATYANSLMFPVALTRRLLKRAGIAPGTDVRPLPAGLGWLNPVFRRILEQESVWFKANRRMPFGLSVLAYAQKPGSLSR